MIALVGLELATNVASKIFCHRDFSPPFGPLEPWVAGLLITGARQFTGLRQDNG